MILTRRGPWTMSMHPPPKRFVFRTRTKFKTCIQIRQWVRSWTAHLGDKATPEAFVDVINRKKQLKAATLLRDKVKKEFKLLI